MQDKKTCGLTCNTFPYSKDLGSVVASKTITRCEITHLADIAFTTCQTSRNNLLTQMLLCNYSMLQRIFMLRKRRVWSGYLCISMPVPQLFYFYGNLQIQHREELLFSDSHPSQGGVCACE